MTQPAQPGAQAVLDWLERTGTAETRAGMARYAIPSDRAYGVTVGELKKEARRLGRDHELALALWETERYEARILAAFVGEPRRVTVAQMDAWCADFDSWAICDTVCFHLFDRTPHAWGRIGPWARRKGEFQKRPAFALLWGLSAGQRGRGRQARRPSGPRPAPASAETRRAARSPATHAARMDAIRIPMGQPPGRGAAAIVTIPAPIIQLPPTRFARRQASGQLRVRGVRMPNTGLGGTPRVAQPSPMNSAPTSRLVTNGTLTP
jgi:hypothetical protein